VSSKEAELRIVLRVRTPSLAAAAAVTYVLLALLFRHLPSLALSLSSVPASLLSMCARACISMSEWIVHSHLGIGFRFGKFN
jgi:hypothetical protein